MPKIAFYRTPKETVRTKISTFFTFSENIREQVKRIILGVWFVANIVFYGVYTNITSTKWYFLTEAKKEREQAEFTYNITKLNTMEYQRKLREKLHHATNITKIDLEANIVYVETKQIVLNNKQETNSN